MTPAELIILFSGYVITFTLLWFTNMAEQVEERDGDAPGRQQAKHPDDSGNKQNAEVGVVAWNVAAFFRLKGGKAR